MKGFDMKRIETFWHFKLIWALCLISGGHPTFFIWNLIVERTSSTFCTMLSLWVIAVGNLPALFRPGPKIRGICLIRLSEARKASYFLAEKHTQHKRINTKYTVNSRYKKVILLRLKMLRSQVNQNWDNRTVSCMCTSLIWPVLEDMIPGTLHNLHGCFT